MAISIKTPIANRFGLNLKIWKENTTDFTEGVEFSGTATVVTGTLTVTADYSVFGAKVNVTEASTTSYDFLYSADGTTWKLDETAVSLAEYGVTVVGEPANSDKITISLVATTNTPLALIDFANITDISVEGDSISATGGQSQRAQVDFNNPLTGTLTISTQLMTAELLTLLAGKDLSTASTTIDFETTDGTVRNAYVITADTVWKDKAHNVYSEKLIAYKALPKRAFSMSHQGEGDPTSTDIVFDLQENDAGKCLTIVLKDKE